MNYDDLCEISLGVLSFPENVVDEDSLCSEEFVKDLLPGVENLSIHVSGPAGKPLACHMTAPPASSAARSLVRSTKIKRHRVRNRKRTVDQRKAENAKRRVQQIEFYARRTHCLEKEHALRSHIREWIRSYAAAIGVRVDAAILPHLPADLRTIMARSDAATLSYRGFVGQSKLCAKLNGMPTWW